MNSTSVSRRLGRSFLFLAGLALLLAAGCAGLAPKAPADETQIAWARWHRTADPSQTSAICKSYQEAGLLRLDDSRLGCAYANNDDDCFVVAMDCPTTGCFAQLGSLFQTCRWKNASLFDKTPLSLKNPDDNKQPGPPAGSAPAPTSWSPESGSEPLRFEMVEIMWERHPRETASQTCQNHFGMTRSKSYGGCALFKSLGAPGMGQCHFAAAPDRSVLRSALVGHEIKHCFDGSFHDQRQLPHPEFFERKVL